MTNYTAPTPETTRVLDDVKAERRRQIEKGWTPEHDDRHATHDLVRLAEHRIHTEGPDARSGYYSRQRIVEGIAMLVAAVEAKDRRDGR